MKSPDAVGAYMARFAMKLAVSPRARGRVLEETEGHLRDAADGRAANGATPMEAQRQAIAAFGEAETAAARFGSSPTGMAWRFVLGLLRRKQPKVQPGAAGSADQPLIHEGEDAGAGMGRPPSPTCDVCGGDVAPGQVSVVDIAAVGAVVCPVPLLVHAACYDISAGIFALLDMPVTAAHRPYP